MANNTLNTLRVGANEGRHVQTRTADMAVARKNEVGVDNLEPLLPTHFPTPREMHRPHQLMCVPTLQGLREGGVGVQPAGTNGAAGFI
jgi:hypothetical protein